MCRVAIGADRSDGQALFVQSLAMDTLRVVGEDAVFRNLILLSDRGPFLVAGAAHEGDVELSHT